MAKQIDYVITSVWFSDNGKNYKHISHVMLHKVSGNQFQEGIKTVKDDVITLIKSKLTIMTVTWSYPKWIIGVPVTSETNGNIEYLKTVKSSSSKFNLVNLISGSAFINIHLSN